VSPLYTSLPTCAFRPTQNPPYKGGVPFISTF